MRAERISEWKRIVLASFVFGSELAAASQPETWAKVRDPSPDKGLEIESAEMESDTSEKEVFSSKEDFAGLGIWLEA